MANDRIYKMTLASVYPLYIEKLERKGIERPKEKVDACIFWLTGYDQRQLQQALDSERDFESFFERAPHLNDQAKAIKGLICGYRVEEIEEPLLWKIRCLDKLIDELARGKSLEKALRKI